ncbi:hypothetical protein ASPCAL05415 [Aspergillus calidoustus]|uniref:Uncharacterized protein n=1 Tax=Aspergillus calidoustus TaxID=454130 RepID=A0A0U5G029_ASPCI|nr:hypothetical protein ASPCAL05415 [Aspergillus calidoustus]
MGVISYTQVLIICILYSMSNRENSLYISESGSLMAAAFCPIWRNSPLSSGVKLAYEHALFASSSYSARRIATNSPSIASCTCMHNTPVSHHLL